MDFEQTLKKYGAEYITSRTNPKTVGFSKLADKKHRDSERLFIAEGVKLTSEALLHSDVHAVLASRSFVENNTEAERILSLALSVNTDITVFADTAFEKLSTEKAPQGVMAVLNYNDSLHCRADFARWQNGKRLLMLDEIRDPGNLGTILRSCEALGIDGVILAGCADIYSPKTVRAAMGTLFRLPLYITNDPCGCVDVMKEHGRRVLSAALGEHSLTLGKYETRRDDCPIIGNEGHGIAPEIIKRSDACVTIPMSGGTESLNAASAAACILWEYCR